MNYKNLFIAIVLMCVLGSCSTNAQEERLSGEFSVSATKKVRFSLGNLRYQVNSQTWDFAKKQSYVVGERNKYYNDKSYDGYIDLFSLDDIEKCKIIQTGKWRILSDKEWNYLLHERINAEELWGYGFVNNQEGLILLPDNWSFSDDENFPFTAGVPYYTGSAGYENKNIFSLEEFLKYEKKGVAFLPFAGYMKMNDDGVFTYTRVYHGRGISYYLTPTLDEYGDNAVIQMRVKDIRRFFVWRGGTRSSIRLVQDVK